MIEVIFVFFTENAVTIGSVGAAIGILEFVFSPFRTLRNKIRGPEKVEVANMPTFAPTPEQSPIEVQVNQPTTDGGLLSISLDDYEQRIAAKIKAAEEKLASAHDAEKAQLLQRTEELTRRAQNPAEALAEAQATIRKLEETLEREGNPEDISDARMKEAREQLENGDFTAADAIFTEIEARELPGVERAARAAFARGEIAEQEVRWHDAAHHFAKAARLHESYDHYHKAREFHWRAGEFRKGIALGPKLINAAISEFGNNSRQHAVSLNEHGLSLYNNGDYSLAEGFFLQATDLDKFKLGKNDPDYAIHLGNLACVYRSTGRFQEAEELFLQSKSIIEEARGKEHPEYARTINNLAALYRVSGKFGKAEPLYLEAITLGKKYLGEHHPSVGVRLNNLALLYRKMARYEESEKLFLQAIKITLKTLGDWHPAYATRLDNLASLYAETGRTEEAEALMSEAIGIAESSLGESHPTYAAYLRKLALLYEKTGRHEEAERLYEQAIDIWERRLGPEHPHTKTANKNLAALRASR